MRVKVPQARTPIEKISDPMEVSISADEANASHIEAGMQAPYGGTRARDIILQKETKFVRVHGEDNQTRSWLMREEDIKGLNAKQIKDKFALPSICDGLIKVEKKLSIDKMRV